ncbi:MAG: hypothetical protein Pars2KO_31240 [Parasphingorhabdus sp.]
MASRICILIISIDVVDTLGPNSHCKHQADRWTMGAIGEIRVTIERIEEMRGLDMDLFQAHLSNSFDRRSPFSIIILCLALFFLISADESYAADDQNEVTSPESIVTERATSPIVKLVPGRDGPPLYSHVRYRTVPMGTSDPMPYLQSSTEFSLLNGQSFIFGPVGTRTLVLISVRNVGDVEGNWVLTTHRGIFENFSISEVVDQQRRLIIDSNNVEQTAKLLRTNHFFTHDLVLQPGEEKQVVILFDSIQLPVLPFEIKTPQSFADSTFLLLTMVVGSSVGILAIVIVSVSIFAATGRPEFFWMGLAELATVAHIVNLGGFFGIYFLYDNIALAHNLGFLIPLLFSTAMSQFARSFTNTRKISPILDRVLLLLIIIGLFGALALVAAALFPDQISTQVTLPVIGLVALVSSLILPYVAIIATRRLGSYYWPLIMAWGGLALFRISTTLVVFGFIPQAPYSFFVQGPIGLFHTFFIFLALLFFLKKLNQERLSNALQLHESLVAQEKIGEKASKLTLENKDAMSTIRDQENLIHASGHDSQHVLMALKTIIKFADEFGSDKLQEKLPDMLKSSASHLEDIIGTTMANPVAGFQSASFIALSSFNTADLLHSLKTIYAPLMRKEQMTLRLESEDDLMLVSDRALLARVLSNLLSNCMKFAKGSEVIVSTRSENDLIHITVKDGGPGIAEHVIDSIHDTSTMRVMPSDPETGTGFGLVSSKRITDALGGYFGLANPVDGGAAITLTLPKLVNTKDSKPMDLDKIQSLLPDYHLIDIDALDEMGINTDDKLQEAMAKNVPILPVSLDNSSQMARRVSKFAALMLLKPVTLSMIEHPLLSRTASEYHAIQQKKDGSTLAREEPS